MSTARLTEMTPSDTPAVAEASLVADVVAARFDRHLVAEEFRN